MDRRSFNFWAAILITIGVISACGNDESNDEVPYTGYGGTGSVSQGLATTTTTNLYPNGGRVAGLGEITAFDNTTWIVPSEVNYTDDSFPFAPDLYNPDGITYVNAAAASANFHVSDIIKVDEQGEVITGYIFADNYFELYVNGTPVGKDAIPFTPFNSHIVKFKVSHPYTIAMKLVDWEEDLGLGTESNKDSDHHQGDGGMVAVFKDAGGQIVATTGSDWKAQTFYTAPVDNLICVTEVNTTRSTEDCDTDDDNDESEWYALHWELPSDWMNEDFDDSDWPDATTYTNETIGVDNKPAYTDFTDVFDAAGNDAEFIWSTNVVLDNEVIVRYTVQ